MNRTATRYGLLTITCVLLWQTDFAQDKIYLQNDQKDGKITEVTTDKVKYKNLQNPGPVYSVSKEKVLFLFNSNGSFLVFDNALTEQAVTQFLQAPKTFPASDLVYKLDGTTLSGEIENEDNQTLYVASKNGTTKLDKSTIAAVIYKNGQHKIHASDMARVAQILKGSRQQTAKAETKAPPPPGNLIVAEKESRQEKTAAPQPKYTQQTEEHAGTSKITAKPAVASEPPTAREKEKPVMFEEMGIDVKEYESKALNKTKELSDYIKVLCDKSTEYDRAEKAIDQACLLFANEDATVSVSSVNRQNVARYRIREYLKKIKLVKYGRVEIEWTKIQYVSKLRKGPDGNYYGIITFEQVFKGYKDNELVYSDVTRKNIEVILKTYKKSIEGKSQSTWDVLLSDIGVVETKQS